ncbi:hypothetical protein BU26DRAFT_532061 [Trematosphaeria pertusa]|uniref:protein-ribulosamine 3-kinase n=1 Tax=Trematosphaeria pertusa TaxID=390896 RepID=A0A6A6IA14_9PLEO|nr:uncharacterized protein BU26DRAFT_532061 [Trematosphaeria pertusa]KAF2247414.1 hypothetical protein BU26DRAFT_532061 [Trematosphaeria pertusa]
MVDEVLDVKAFVDIVAKVHRASMGKSPNGKFGFAQDSWEKWYTQAMQAMYEFEKQTQGEDEELDNLFDALCKEVIPRLLRPLETGGRSIKPCLVHSDLWPGNCIPYLKQYQKVMGMSEPHGDWDDRNALYAFLPSAADFAREVAKLHKESSSPNNMFGFHINTYNGTLEQDNTWTTSWEEGTSEELKELSGALLEKVIPRLLRPLETQGRTVRPSLLHGDLWIGNVATDKATTQPIIFDSSAYYGHNEYELSPLRPINSQWSRDCLEEYHKNIPKDAPVEDWGSRNALYALCDTPCLLPVNYD